jgi:hypothetical protein
MSRCKDRNVQSILEHSRCYRTDRLDASMRTLSCKNSGGGGNSRGSEENILPRIAADIRLTEHFL